MDNVLNTLNKRLMALRTSYQLPVLEAEWVCGVSRSTLNNWERGLRVPYADGLFQIATSYGVSMDWLFGVSNAPYTAESIELAEATHKPEEHVNDVLKSIGYGPESETKKLTKKYVNSATRAKYAPATRANILVYTLYITGYLQYFAERDGTAKAPTAQQNTRLLMAQRGLVSALASDTASSFPLQQNGFPPLY